MAGRPWRRFVALASIVCGCSTSPHASDPDATVGMLSEDAGNEGDAGAFVDASADDSTSPDDATADADDAASDAGIDGAPSHWCDQQLHAFCDDFDEDPLMQGWDSLATQAGQVTLDGVFYTSPGRALLSTVSPLAAGATGMARLGKRTIELSNDIRLAYDVRPDALDPSAGDLAISTIELFAQSGAIVESVHVLVNAAGASVQDIGVGNDGGAYVSSHSLSASPLSGTWTRVSLALALPSEGGLGAGTVTASLGSTVVIDHAPLSPSSRPALPVFFVGLVSQNSTSPGTSAVRFDNVTFDAIQR